MQHFPTEFLIDSPEGDFIIDYSIDVNQICFTGKSLIYKALIKIQFLGIKIKRLNCRLSTKK